MSNCEFTYPTTEWPHWRRCSAEATTTIAVQHGGHTITVEVCDEHAKVDAR